MIRRDTVEAVITSCIPRESGDDPELGDAEARVALYSPRERG